jgi:hypothetical protein
LGVVGSTQGHDDAAFVEQREDLANEVDGVSGDETDWGLGGRGHRDGRRGRYVSGVEPGNRTQWRCDCNIAAASRRVTEHRFP